MQFFDNQYAGGGNQDSILPKPKGSVDLPAKPKGLMDLPDFIPKDGISVGDVANKGGDLANWLFGQFAGLTPQVASIYEGVLQGHMPEVARQLLAPITTQLVSQINSQVPTAIRQLTDNLQGGALAEGIFNAINAPIPAIAQGLTQLLSSLYNPLVSGAMEAGQNSPMRVWQVLRDIGLLRIQKKGVDASGGGGLLGGLL